MSILITVFLFVLLMLVAVAGVSFVQHKVVALLVLLALPFCVVLQTLRGTVYAVFVVGLLATGVAVIHTISDTLRLLRAANRKSRRDQQTRAHRRVRSRSERSRSAA